MCAYNRADRDLAVQLRMQDGATDESVSEATGIPIGSIRRWTPGAPGRREYVIRQSTRHGNSGTNEERSTRRAMAEQIAELDFPEAMKDPIVSMGIGLWLGEGLKVGARNRVSMGSTDPTIIMLFARFLDRIGLDTAALRARILVPNHPEASTLESAVAWWEERIGFTDDQMAKPAIEAATRKKSPNHPNGTCTVYAFDVEARIKINIWTQMAIDSLIGPS